MAVVSGTYSSAQTNTVLVVPQGTKVIRVMQVVFSAWGGTRLTLVSDPGGGGQVNIAPPLHLPTAGGSLVLRLGRSFALAAERAKALGITTSFSGAAADHSVIIWYEAVS
jgi:hypothetical protein